MKFVQDDAPRSVMVYHCRLTSSSIVYVSGTPLPYPSMYPRTRMSPALGRIHATTIESIIGRSSSDPG